MTEETRRQVNAAVKQKGRYWFTATSLANDQVLVVGGRSYNHQTTVRGEEDVPFAEIYAPADGKFIPITQPMVMRWDHTAMTLTDGTVLVVGGMSETGPVLETELYDHEKNVWASAGTLSFPRLFPRLLVKQGTVVVTSGFAGYEGHTELDEGYDEHWFAPASWRLYRRTED